METPLTLPRARTLNDLLDAYRRDHLPHKAPRTQYTEGLLFDWLATTLGPLPLAQLTPLVLRSWRDSLASSGYKPNTIRRYMTALSAVLTAGVDHYGWLPAHPMRAKVKKPPRPPDRERCLDADELRRLLRACEGSSNGHLAMAVILALSTGARKNELLQRTWAEVDLARRLLSIPQSKNGERRAIPLTAPVVELLQDHRLRWRSTWVFPRRDGKKPMLLEYAWRVACAVACLDGFHFHDLRHCAASYLAMSGATLQEIAAVLGHKSLEQTKKYISLTEPHTRTVLERMAAQFLPVLLFVWALAVG